MFNIGYGNIRRKKWRSFNKNTFLFINKLINKIKWIAYVNSKNLNIGEIVSLVKKVITFSRLWIK